VLTSAAKLPELPQALSPQHHIADPLMSPKKSETKLPLPPKIHRTTKEDLSIGIAASVAVFILIFFFRAVCATGIVLWSVKIGDHCLAGNF